MRNTLNYIGKQILFSDLLIIFNILNIQRKKEILFAETRHVKIVWSLLFIKIVYCIYILQ